jgi:hypothetical protein
MTTEVLAPDSEWSMNPEAQTVCESYLITTDVTLTAQDLGIPKQKVVYYLNRPEVKRFLDTIYFEQGFLNRNRLQDILGEVMELKLEEMRDSEIGTKKDILDVVALLHKIRADEAKISSLGNEGPSGPKTQNNTQVNIGAGFGDNYNALLEQIMSVEK